MSGFLMLFGLMVFGWSFVIAPTREDEDPIQWIMKTPLEKQNAAAACLLGGLILFCVGAAMLAGGLR